MKYKKILQMMKWSNSASWSKFYVSITIPKKVMGKIVKTWIVLIIWTVAMETDYLKKNDHWGKKRTLGF